MIVLRTENVQVSETFGTESLNVCVCEVICLPILKPAEVLLSVKSCAQPSASAS